MADDNTSFVQKLIADSKKLTEANVKKCETERTLKELTMFKNVSSLCKEGSFALSEAVFRISIKVLPGVHRFGENGYCEILTLAVENISKNFHFNPSYWQFVVDIGDGKKVSSWSLESIFEPGKIEKFSTSFTTSLEITPIDVQVSLIFSINLLEECYVKTLDLQRLLIDVLHMISPARVPREQFYDSIGSVSSNRAFGDINFTETSTDSRKFPSVTQFFLKFDSVMLKYFLDNILLHDSKERFLGNGLTDLSTSTNPSICLYYQEEEIILKHSLDGGTVSVKCSNPRLLCAFKSAIFTRLMMVKNVKVISPNDSVCEKLYGLKLRIEEMGRPSRDDFVDVDQRDMMDLYLELRDIGEAVQFILLSDVE